MASAVLALAGLAFGQAGVDGAEGDAPRPVQIAEGDGTPQSPLEVFTVAPDERLSPTTLYLAVGRVDTAARVDVGQLAASVDEATKDDRFVLQLDGPLTPERRERLEDAGVDVGVYLPMHAYVVRLHNADAQKVGQLGFVRWHHRYEDGWKLSPELETRDFSDEARRMKEAQGVRRVDVTLFRGVELVEAIAELEGMLGDFSHLRTARMGDDTMVRLEMRTDQLDALKAATVVRFVEPSPDVQLRNNTVRWIVQSNAANVTPMYDAGIRGEGQIIGIIDSRVNESHCSFNDSASVGPNHRKILAYNTSFGSAFHGTHVAGTAVGDAGSDADTRGVAYEAKMTFHTTPSFSDSALYSRLQLHHNQGARIHTNSWGDDGTTAYNGLPRGIDRFSYDFEESLVLFAVTNGSSLRNPENAKNVLAVGASQDTPAQSGHCTGGDGPTADGRRKPEIYAPGCGTLSASGSGCSTSSATGTSMASPAVAGAAALARQYFVEGYYPTGFANPSEGFTPTGALIKATLLNSTVDMTSVPGFPSNREGWGRLLLDNALALGDEPRRLLVEEVRNAEGLSTGEFVEVPVEVIDNRLQLNVTAVWTEPPASSGASVATINDLDLVVISPSGETYVGNDFSGGFSVLGNSRDDKNNVEQVRLQDPEQGTWIVRMEGSAVNVGTQGFAIAVSGGLEAAALPVQLALDSPVPAELNTGETLTVQIAVNPGDDSLVPGSVRLFVAEDGVTFTPASLSQTAPGVFEGVIGPFECVDTPAFYAEAQGVDSGQRFASGASLASPATLAIGETILGADEDLEQSTGWVVNPDGTDSASTGIWTRAEPIPTGAAPGSDTTEDGTFAFVTGNGGGSLGTDDIDGGRTTLMSPAFDLSGLSSATLTYNRWFSNDTGASPNDDAFVIEVSNDNGVTWTNLETVGPFGAGTSGGWVNVEFQLESFVELTPQVRVRFLASDFEPASVVEAAIDDLRISEFTCEDVPAGCPGDFDGSGTVDGADFGTFGAAFGSSAGDANYNPDADFNDDGTIDGADFGTFGAAFGSTCSG